MNILWGEEPNERDYLIRGIYGDLDYFIGVVIGDSVGDGVGDSNYQSHIYNMDGTTSGCSHGRYYLEVGAVLI